MITGKTSALPGFKNRLEKELKMLYWRSITDLAPSVSDKAGKVKT
jgi:actin-related protein